MESIWQQTCDLAPRQPLRGAIKTGVAVIGGGMAGVLTARALAEAGRPVVVLEARRLGSGQTGGTTAKLTAQHGLIYARLLREQGEERARLYAQAAQTAVELCRRRVREAGLDCDFRDAPAILYGDDREALAEEEDAARRLGLPMALTPGETLPIPAQWALTLPAQAQFHPLKLLRAAAEGLTVYEHRPVRVEDDHTLITPEGRAEAEQVVFACHYPFVNFPGLYFARLHQERSYVLALSGAPRVEGMLLGVGQEALSLRSWHDLLLLGGEGHRTGENQAGGCYDRLRRQAGELFPGCQETAHWSAQDCVTPDGVPYIGVYAPSRPDWYVATGFRKWGMTGSVTAALVLRDLLLGRACPWASVFDPGRLIPAATPKVLAEGGEAVKGLARQLFHIPADAAGDIPPGHGGVVLLDGKKAGVYKAPDGTLYPVDLRCPHLGCELAWNPDDLCWECPCHGSRFDARGRLLAGPAQTGIEVEGKADQG